VYHPATCPAGQQLPTRGPFCSVAPPTPPIAPLCRSRHFRSSAELPATSAFPPATPGSLATAPDNFFPKPSFFSLTPPKEEGSGYRPYPTHLPTSRGLVPYSDSLPQSSDHFRKLACTSIALPPPSGTLCAPALSCAPVPRRVVPHTQSDLAVDKPRTRIA